MGQAAAPGTEPRSQTAPKDAHHTYATLALASGKSLRWVAAQLGHTNPAITLRVYPHALREEEADLASSISAAPNGTPAAPSATGLRKAESPPA
jgi:integrase